MNLIDTQASSRGLASAKFADHEFSILVLIDSDRFNWIETFYRKTTFGPVNYGLLKEVNSK